MVVCGSLFLCVLDIHVKQGVEVGRFGCQFSTCKEIAYTYVRRLLWMFVLGFSTESWLEMSCC